MLAWRFSPLPNTCVELQRFSPALLRLTCASGLGSSRPRWSSGEPAQGLPFEAGWFRIPSASGKKDLKDFGIRCSGAAVFPLVLNFRSYPNAFFEPASSTPLVLRCSSGR